MDGQEFIPIASTLQRRWWAFEIPAGALDGYLHDLADVLAAKVAAAVDVASARGFDRPPTSGQVRRIVGEMELDAPTWDEARLALVQWRRRRGDREAVRESWTCPHSECDGTGWLPVDGRRAMRHCSCRQAYMTALRGWDTLPPLVCEFVRDDHVLPAELDRMLDQGDTTSEAQVRKRWEQFVGRAIDSRVFAGLPGGTGMARLDAARDEDDGRRERTGELRRLDGDRFVATIGTGRAA